MLKLLSSSFIALTLVSAAPVFAKSSCSCSEKCMDACHKGKSENCHCKECGCSKGTGCSHGKCSAETTENKKN